MININVHFATINTKTLNVLFLQQKDGLVSNKTTNVQNVSKSDIGLVHVILNLADDATDHIIHSSASVTQLDKC